jgi:hypothetical protein
MSGISGQAATALVSLYAQARRTNDNFDLDRIDRALDEVARLNSTEPPPHQVRSAMANALKVMTRRREIAPCESLDAPGADLGVKTGQEEAVDLRAWLRDTKRITEQQRRLLTLLADDYDSEAIAALYRIPTPRMREQISRARRAARAAYDGDISDA